MARSKLGDMVPNIKKAMDKGFRDFMIDTQSALGEANPKDTGRMSSSWFIGQNQPDTSVRPENWGDSKEKRYEARSTAAGSPLTGLGTSATHFPMRSV